MKKDFLYILMTVTLNQSIQSIIESMDNNEPLKKFILPKKTTVERPDALAKRALKESLFQKMLINASAAQARNKEEREISLKRDTTSPIKSQEIKYFEPMHHNAIREEISDVQEKANKLEYEMQKDYSAVQKNLQEIKELLAEQDTLS